MAVASSFRAQRAGAELRWYFVALVTAAIAVSYFDRQTVSVAIPAIQRSIPVSQQVLSALLAAQVPYNARGFNIKQVSYYAWIPYAASGLGSFLGGWLSGVLLRRGSSLDVARKAVLGINALMTPAVMLVPHVSVSAAMLCFSIAFFAQQSWSGLIMTIPADVFPLSAVVTVADCVGLGGSLGGALFGLVAGAMLGHGISYQVLFLLAGSFHLVGFLALLFAGGQIRPLRYPDLEEMELSA